MASKANRQLVKRINLWNSPKHTLTMNGSEPNNGIRSTDLYEQHRHNENLMRGQPIQLPADYSLQHQLAYHGAYGQLHLSDGLDVSQYPSYQSDLSSFPPEADEQQSHPQHQQIQNQQHHQQQPHQHQHHQLQPHQQQHQHQHQQHSSSVPGMMLVDTVMQLAYQSDEAAMSGLYDPSASQLFPGYTEVSLCPGLIPVETDTDTTNAVVTAVTTASANGAVAVSPCCQGNSGDATTTGATTFMGLVEQPDGTGKRSLPYLDETGSGLDHLSGSQDHLSLVGFAPGYLTYQQPFSTGDQPQPHYAGHHGSGMGLLGVEASHGG
ncbi:unnamed protein product, partial [Protopolystoma xenopodis]